MLVRPRLRAVCAACLFAVSAACSGSTGGGEAGRPSDGSSSAGAASPGAGTSAAESPQAAGGVIKNPDTYVDVELADFITSLDPAFAYDTGSGSIILNVYEPLVYYDGEHTDRFKPVLATEIPTTENGLITDGGQTLAFPIRSGITFQAGGSLTPEDVAYTFQRGMLQDGAGGPQWLLIEPLLGESSILDVAKSFEKAAGNAAADDIEDMDGIGDAARRATCEAVQAAVTVDGDKVVFHLKRPFAAFLPVLAGTWGFILDKEWVASETTGDDGAKKAAGWDGSCDTWTAFYDPPLEDNPLRSVMNGTGPYKLTRWRREEEIVLDRNDAYWGEHKAHLKQIVFKFVSEFATRLLMLQSGDADLVAVLDSNRDQVMPLVEHGLVTEYKDLPEVSAAWWALNQNVVTEGNDYIGSGKLDGAGVPPDLFADVDARRGFAYAYDQATFIGDILQGGGKPLTTVIPSFVGGHDASLAGYPYDLAKATEAFQRALGGKLWETGFTLAVPLVPGNSNGRLHREMYAKSLSDVNPKFKLVIREVQASQFQADEEADRLPIRPIGWVEDFHDPHNWAFPLLHSNGYYARKLDFPEALSTRLDGLIEQARGEADPQARNAQYAEIQKIVNDEVLFVPIDEDVGRVYMRSWVKGYIHNAAAVGSYYADFEKKN